MVVAIDLERLLCKLCSSESLACDGLHRGLREACKAIESRKALICILAQDCDQADYTKLIQAALHQKSTCRMGVRSHGAW